MRVDWTPPTAPDLDDIRTRLNDAVTEAFAAGVRWEWQPYDAELESPHPFGRMRVGESPVGLRRSWTPRNEARAVKYGWDEHDRLRVARRFDDLWGDVVPASDRVLTFLFSAAGDHLDIRRGHRPNGTQREELRTVTRRIVEDGRLLGFVEWPAEPSRERPLWVRTTLEFDDDGDVSAVMAARVRADDDIYVELGDPQRRLIRFEATRDAAKDIVALHRQEFDDAGEPDSERKLVWQRTNKEEVRAAQAFIAEELPRAIAAWAQRLLPQTAAAYCLAIAYDSSWSASLGIGTAVDLDRFGPPGSTDRLDMMWNPAEFACFDAEPDELNTPALKEAYRVTSAGWGSNTDDKIRAACVKAASALAASELGADTAEPFLIYATDLELIDLDANLKKLRGGRTRRAIERQTG